MTAREPGSGAVDAWLQRVGRQPGADTIAAFELAFATLWRRARETLGEVTLVAVTERVLFDAAERFAAFASVGVDAGGLRCDRARARLRSMSEDDQRDAVRFVLTTWLDLLGNLTGGILTPPLLAALSRVGTESPTPPNRTRGTRSRKDRKS
jgi:hypothetical protein